MLVFISVYVIQPLPSSFTIKQLLLFNVDFCIAYTQTEGQRNSLLGGVKIINRQILSLFMHPLLILNYLYTLRLLRIITGYWQMLILASFWYN